MGSHDLVWLKNKADNSFPCLWIPRPSDGIIVYSHGNGGTVRDWYALLKFYAERFVIYYFFFSLSIKLI